MSGYCTSSRASPSLGVAGGGGACPHGAVPPALEAPGEALSARGGPGGHAEGAGVFRKRKKTRRLPGLRYGTGGGGSPASGRGTAGGQGPHSPCTMGLCRRTEPASLLPEGPRTLPAGQVPAASLPEGLMLWTFPTLALGAPFLRGRTPVQGVSVPGNALTAPRGPGSPGRRASSSRAHSTGHSPPSPRPSPLTL